MASRTTKGGVQKYPPRAKGPFGLLGDPWGPKGGPEGNSMGLVSSIKCVSRGGATPRVVVSRKFFRRIIGLLTLDLAEGGRGATRDPINPLPMTLLY